MGSRQCTVRKMDIYIAFMHLACSKQKNSIFLSFISASLALLACTTTTLAQLTSYRDSDEDLMADASAISPQMSPIDMLIMAVPGQPGEDYPILAEVPETAFSCEGRTEGGYYADVEADCQPFHVCVNDGGSLAKFSFLCPNGTLFRHVAHVQISRVIDE